LTTLSAFRALTETEPVKPARVVLLQPEDFADGWKSRPTAAVAVGLRRLSESDEQTAITDATKEATSAAADCLPAQQADEFVRVFNERLMCIGVGRSLCDPNDVSRPYTVIPMAEDLLGTAVTRGTLERLWHALEAVCGETSACFKEADDDDLGRLCLAIADGAIDELNPAMERRARRFLAMVLDDIDEGES
jgi:hypothetical protein